tara:strand:- start:423 stop:1148 length:726 start_codon:yes stop_codon:yes gene_type:complete
MFFRILVSIIIPILSFSLIKAADFNSKSFQIGLIQYEPGDWNSDQSALTELIKFIKLNTNIPIRTINRDIDLKLKIGSNHFYKTKYLYMTGHGEKRNNGSWHGIKLKPNEIKALRKHLLNGGFLHVDDNYNFDKSFFSEMKKVFPEKEWVELNEDHIIFDIFFKFENGLPKIHEHDKKKPKALALYHNGKIISIYTLESDLGDGWESNLEHERVTGKILDPKKRLEALKMGTNIIIFALSQ